MDMICVYPVRSLTLRTHPPSMDDDKTPEATPREDGRGDDTMNEMDDDRDETTADEDEDEDESIESERSIDRSRLDS